MRCEVQQSRYGFDAPDWGLCLRGWETSQIISNSTSKPYDKRNLTLVKNTKKELEPFWEAEAALLRRTSFKRVCLSWWHWIFWMTGPWNGRVASRAEKDNVLVKKRIGYLEDVLVCWKKFGLGMFQNPSLLRDPTGNDQQNVTSVPRVWSCICAYQMTLTVFAEAGMFLYGKECAGMRNTFGVDGVWGSQVSIHGRWRHREINNLQHSVPAKRCSNTLNKDLNRLYWDRAGKGREAVQE